MTVYRLIHAPTGRVAAAVTRADDWWAKGWGVLGHSTLPAGQGLWLPGVASVHTFFVRFPLDLLFLDSQMRTLKTAEKVPPGRWLVRAPGAAHTLELGVGTLASLAIPIRFGDGWQVERDTPGAC